jgi:7-cyano-7-deazaguanine synthase
VNAALVLFSAGQDSATCLAWALDRYERVETIGFDYGQRHAVELDQRPVLRTAIADLKPQWRLRLGADVVVDLSGYGALAESALTADRAIEMAENGLPTTFVPGRNLVFLSVAAAHAYRRDAAALVGGMCETDFSGYPDCRRETLDAMQSALTLGLAAPMQI